MKSFNFLEATIFKIELTKYGHKIEKVARNCVVVKVLAAASSLRADEKFRFSFFLFLLYVFYAYSNIQDFSTPH